MSKRNRFGKEAAKRRDARYSTRVLTPFVMAALVVGFNACGSRSDSGLTEVVEIKECAEYSAAFRACAQKLGGSEAIVNRQAATLRRQVSDQKDETSQTQMRQACIENARLVRESCR